MTVALPRLRDEFDGFYQAHFGQVVAAALRKLPQRQREVVVWHHIADQPVDEVARQLDVPIGTVKTWLQRGRHSMAAELGMDVQQQVTTPPAEQTIERGRRRRRNRSLMAGVLLLLVVLGGLRYSAAAAAFGSTGPTEPGAQPQINVRSRPRRPNPAGQLGPRGDHPLRDAGVPSWPGDLR